MINPIVIDTETTGLARHDRIVEISMLTLDHETLAPVDGAVFTTMVNPGGPIPPEVTAIHGITDEDVRDKPRFSEISGFVRGMIESAAAVIGHNVSFDVGMISEEFARLGEAHVRWPPAVCTKHVWDIYEPREQRHLQNAYRRFVDSAGFSGAHRSLADASATARVIARQVLEFKLQGIPWDRIDPQRRLWWGPTGHILLGDDGILRVNFGKNRGRSVLETSDSFWRWVTERDFPKHVVMLAFTAMRTSHDEVLTEWARKYRHDS